MDLHLYLSKGLLSNPEVSMALAVFLPTLLSLQSQTTSLYQLSPSFLTLRSMVSLKLLQSLAQSKNEKVNLDNSLTQA